jgi:hypothetical protein
MFTHLTEAAAAGHRADLRRQADLQRLVAVIRADRSSRHARGGRSGRAFAWAAAGTARRTRPVARHAASSARAEDSIASLAATRESGQQAPARRHAA